MVSRVEEILLAKGVKPTPQRVVIAEYIIGTDCHPTAEQILEAVADRLPVQLSRATVYNTLKTLVDAGVIIEVFTEPGRARYDANITDHHHFVDVKTGRIVDIPAELVPKLQEQLGDKYKVHNYTITFYGEVENEVES
jgi:Fur family transcriptional regulator, iron response regulator